MGSIWRPHTNTLSRTDAHANAHACYTDTALVPPHTHNYTHILYAHPFTQTLDSPFSNMRRSVLALTHEKQTSKQRYRAFSFFFLTLHTDIDARVHTPTCTNAHRHTPCVIVCEWSVLADGLTVLQNHPGDPHHKRQPGEGMRESD